APGGLVQVVRRQQDGARRQGAGVAQHPQGLDGGGDPALHVGGAAAGEVAVLDRRGNEGQVNRVEVAVELQGPAGAGPGQADDDGGGNGVAGGRAVDGEAIGGQDPGQAVGGRARLAGPAGDGDEPRGRV